MRGKLRIRSPDKHMGLFDFGDRLCPWCGTELNLKDNYDDEAKTFRCHNCGAKFRIEPIACRYIAIKQH